MTTLSRQPQKVFAGSADADQIAAFGSMKTGTPVYSTSLATLQSTEYTEGWSEAILDDKAPYLEEMNAVQYGLSYQIAYLLQEGIPEYDANTNYSATSIVKVINNNKLELYHSLQDDNEGNALTNPSYWSKVSLSDSGAIGQPQISLNFNTLPEDCIWLEGAAVSRTTYANLFAIYGTAYGEGDGLTTFNLPDCRNKVMWGDTTAGYIAAGLPNITGSHRGIYHSDGWGVTGVYYMSSSGLHTATAGTKTGTLNFNASRSSSIYGNSNTVQPPAIKVRVFTRYQ